MIFLLKKIFATKGVNKIVSPGANLTMRHNGIEPPGILLPKKVLLTSICETFGP